jgi:hypothetical protein
MANSSNVVFNNIDISGFSKSKNTAKNTDGWDTYRSSDITIMNSVINNGDGELTSLYSLPTCLDPGRILRSLILPLPRQHAVKTIHGTCSPAVNAPIRLERLAAFLRLSPAVTPT